MSFHLLHQKHQPLLICNVWDVPSARAAEQAGMQAIGTSSGAIARMLGYHDGEDLPFETLMLVVSRIAAQSSLPLSVDLEGGYSRDPLQIVRHLQALDAVGIAGVNIEDSVVEEGKRTILKAEAFAKVLEQIKSGMNSLGLDLFLNIRTDPFLLGLPNPLMQSIRRGQQYAEAGADGVFVPCIERTADIQAVVDAVSLPVNVMCMPNLDDFATLEAIGVRRISMGSFAQTQMHRQLDAMLKNVLSVGAFTPLFA